MNLHQLLQGKNFGLYYPFNNEYIRWIPSMASDANVDKDEGEEDYPVYLFIGIKADDYAIFAADAEVTAVDDEEDACVCITDINGQNQFFNVFRTLTHEEIFA
jgi:hypothetical protein